MTQAANRAQMDWAELNEFKPKYFCMAKIKFLWDIMKNNLMLNHNHRGLISIHLKFNQSMKFKLRINET